MYSPFQGGLYAKIVGHIETDITIDALTKGKYGDFPFFCMLMHSISYLIPNLKSIAIRSYSFQFTMHYVSINHIDSLHGT